MKNVAIRTWKEDEGVLSFEWVLLVTLLTIGIVSGVAGARDAIIDELGDVAQAMLALDQSYTVDFPLEVVVHVPISWGRRPKPFGLRAMPFGHMKRKLLGLLLCRRYTKNRRL